MVVKDKAGRRRYILFDAPDPAPSRGGFSKRIGDRPWKLTVYTGDQGILRVPHTDVDDARAFLEAQGARPVTTSGTIKKAKQAGDLA